MNPSPQQWDLTRLAWTCAALVLSILYGLPALYLFANKVSLVAVANESLSYRYFYSLRVIGGEGPALFLPQGQSLWAMHVVFQGIMSEIFGIPLDDLKLRMEAFGYATLAMNWAVGAVTLFIALPSRILQNMDKLALAAVALAFVYGSRSGISAAMTPDYYGFEASFTILALWLSLALWRGPGLRHPSRCAAWLGLLGGVMVATKITLATTAALPLLTLLARHPESGRKLAGWAVIFGAAAAICGLGLVATAYQFDPASVAAFFQRWIAFVRNPGVSEPAFWASLLRPWSAQANPGAAYGYAALLYPLCLALLILGLVRATRRAGLWSPEACVLWTITAMTGLHLWGLLQRPAGTTLWEIGLFLTAAATLGTAVLPETTRRHMLRSILIVALLCQSGYSASRNFTKVISIESYKESSAKIWEAHAFLRKQPEGALVLIPNNNHTAGTVEEGMLKGLSDFPTWDIKGGEKMLKIIAPGIKISQDLKDLPHEMTVMWIDIAGAESLAHRFPALQRRLEAAGGVCRNWEIATWEWWRRRITICPGIGG